MDFSMAEIILKDAISSVLGGCDGDFYELGGTSMDAIMIESALLDKGYVLSAADILQNPEIQEMAKLMTPADEFDWEAE